MKIISNICLSEENELTPICASEAYDGIILNHGDHAYCLVAFDTKTVAFLISSLHTVEDYLDRTIVWRHLPFLMRLQFIDTFTYF